MFAELSAAPSRLDADEPHTRIRNERVKNPDGVAAPAHTGEDPVRQPTCGLLDLRASLNAHHFVKFADHQRIRVRAERRAEQIVRGRDIGDPVAHSLIDGVFEGPAAAGHADHLRAQQPHAEYVEPLPPHVFLTHVDHAIQTEQRTNRGRGDAVLSGARFCDDALFPHAPRQHRLAQAVVDLVRAGVQQVFTLDIDSRAAQLFSQPPREIERGRTSGVGMEQLVQFRLKCRIFARFEERALQLFERRHQHLGHVAPAVRSEMSAGVGLRSHLPNAASRNRAMRSWSFLPGALSSREQASTPHGCACAMACRTLVASRPPAIITFFGLRAPIFQSNATPFSGPSSSTASAGYAASATGSKFLLTRTAFHTRTPSGNSRAVSRPWSWTTSSLTARAISATTPRFSSTKT